MKRSASARDRKARAMARDLARRHRPERAMDDVLARAAEDAGRVVALPRKARAHETPALTQAARAAEAAEAAEAQADAPAPAGVRAARKRIAAANRRFMEEDEEWLR